MLTGLSVLLMAYVLTGFGVGVVALLAALHIFVSSVRPASSVPEFVLLSGIVLAVPAAALFASLFLEHFAFGRKSGKIFPALALALAFSLMLETGAAMDYLDSALQVTSAGQSLDYAAFAVSLGSSVLFYGGLIAISLMVAALLFEAPFYWLTSAAGIKDAMNLGVLRPLIVVMLFSLAFNHIAGLISEELWPATVFAALTG